MWDVLLVEEKCYFMKKNTSLTYASKTHNNNYKMYNRIQPKD